VKNVQSLIVRIVELNVPKVGMINEWDEESYIPDAV
jgi:hypothetical protein